MRRIVTVALLWVAPAACLLAGCGGASVDTSATATVLARGTGTAVAVASDTRVAATLEVATSQAMSTSIALAAATAAARFRATAVAAGKHPYVAPTSPPATAVTVRRPTATPPSTPRPRRRPTATAVPTVPPLNYRALYVGVVGTLQTDVPSDLATAIGLIGPSELQADPHLAAATTYLNTATAKLDLAAGTVAQSNVPARWGRGVAGLAHVVAEYRRIILRLQHAEGYVRTGNKRYLDALLRSRNGIRRAERDLGKAQDVFPASG